jgi:hypothetical protein
MADDSPLSRLSRAIPPPGRSGILILALTYTAGLAVSNVTFNQAAVIALAALTVVTLLTIPGGTTARWTISVAALFSVVSLIVRVPAVNVVPTAWFDPAIIVGGVTTGIVALVPWLRPRRSLLLAVFAAIATSYALIVLGGRPLIDVWIILRDSANGLLEGRNPYAMMFPGVPPGQTGDCFNYLPASFLLTAPGQWLFGDVRWLEAGDLFAAVALLGWQATDGGRRWTDARLPIVLLLGVMPGTIRVVQQSWNEPILLLGLVAGAVLLDRGRPNWAVLPIALALATKQHVVVLLPLLLFWPAFGWRRVVATAAVAGAICLPWFLADPARFYDCTVAFYVSTPFLARSVSAWQLFPEPLRMPALIVALLVAYGVALRRLPRNGSGLLIGLGAILMTFDLMNKQTFMNQWVLAAELVMAGLALGHAPAEDSRVRGVDLP